MQTLDIPRQFLGLSAKNLEQMANYYETMARTCRDRAKVHREKDERAERCAARADFLERSYKTVLEYLSKGYNSPESAIDAAARELGLPAFAVESWWRLWLKKKTVAARTERNRVIIDLVKLGVSNKDIAARLGLHPNTITRAINGYLFNGLRPSDRQRLYKRRKISQ